MPAGASVISALPSQRIPSPVLSMIGWLSLPHKVAPSISPQAVRYSIRNVSFMLLSY